MDVSVKQLQHVKKHLRADDGGGGQTKACHGRNGKDLIVKVTTRMITTLIVIFTHG